MKELSRMLKWYASYPHKAEARTLIYDIWYRKVYKTTGKEKLIFDIGAHEGMASLYFHKSTSARIVSVEPNPHSVKHLLRNTQNFDRVHVVDRALSPRASTKLMLRPDNLRSTGSGEHVVKTHIYTEPVRVPTTSWKELVSSFGTPDFVKIDAEGAEDYAISEICSLSEKPSRIFFEEHKQNNMQSILTKLKRSGYVVSKNRNIFQAVKPTHINP